LSLSLHLRLAPAIAVLACGCGGPRTGAVEPGGHALDLSATDIVVPGEAVIVSTTMEALAGSRLGSVLIEGLERQASARVPALAKALEAAARAPIEDAGRIVITGRPLDEDSALLAVGVEYAGEASWFEDMVRGFHSDREEEDLYLADLDRGAVLGVIEDDTSAAWGTSLTAAVCAVRFTPNLVAYVAAPDAGECRIWASWIIARTGGDERLVDKIAEAPGIGGEPPPLAAYADGTVFEKLCCAPFGLSKYAAGVEEAWIGLDPGSPATLSAVVRYEKEGRAESDRNKLAGILDVYAPAIHILLPGLEQALSSMSLAADATTLTASMTIDAQTVEKLADLLSTML